jgi:hypothetical protein
MKKYIIFALLITTFYSYEEEVDYVNYNVHVANFDTVVDYQLQFNNNNKTIDTVLLAYSDEKIYSVELSDTVFNELISLLPEYTDEEFSEVVRTLKIFRIIEGDTIYYRGSEDYSLDKDNWQISYAKGSGGTGRYEYFLRLGKY